jgi:hypothetical protein
MSKALNGMGPEALKVLIASDPKALFGIVRELSRVAKLLTAKGVISDAKESAGAADEGPQLSEEEQQAKIVAMVDAALGIKGK